MPPSEGSLILKKALSLWLLYLRFQMVSRVAPPLGAGCQAGHLLLGPVAPPHSPCLPPERLAPVWLQPPQGRSRGKDLCSLFCNLNFVAVGPALSTQTALLMLNYHSWLRMRDARGGGNALSRFPWHLFRAWLRQLLDRHPPVFWLHGAQLYQVFALLDTIVSQRSFPAPSCCPHRRGPPSSASPPSSA